EEKCEPNFIPLLDLVLQLVMFFMICANFVLEQTDVAIVLPRAVAAQAITANDGQVIYLNINEKGELLLPPSERYTNPDGTETKILTNAKAIEIYLKRRSHEEEGSDKRSLIILRVHKLCPFEKTFEIMQACRNVGYQRVQLRAEIGGGT